MSRKLVPAIGYLQTSSSANVGEGKDSETRQHKAIEAYAKRADMVVVEWFYDAAVSSADPIETRPGFAAILARIGKARSDRVVRSGLSASV
jgi:DNA invertase Pin-like site-specific DNA recombinase